MKTALRWAIYVPLFTIPFLSLVVFGPPFFPNFFFPFITGKGFLFRIFVEIAFVAWVALAAVDKAYRPKFSWTLAIFSAFTLWMLIADSFGVNPQKALWSNFERMDGFVTLVHTYAFFLVMATVLTADKLWRKWWLTFLSAVGLICLYGLMQMGGMLAIHQGSTRVDATLGNAAYLAAYFLFAIAVSLWCALESKGWLRYLLYILTAIEVLILFSTATRGAIIALVGAALLGSVLWAIESGKTARKGAFIVIAGLIVLVGAFFVAKDTSFVKNDEVLGRLASISLADGTTRFSIWNIAYQGFLERPILGWGQEGFNQVFNKYYDPSLFAQEQWFDRAHDVFLDWLIAGGMPALLLFLALMGSAVYVLYRGGASRAERVMLVAALAAYSFQAIFVFDNLFTYIPLAALLACAHAAAARPIKKLEEIPEVPQDSQAPIILPVALVVGIALIWVVNAPNMAAASDIIGALSPQKDFSVNLELFKKTIADGSFASQEIREQLLSYASGVVGQPTATLQVKNDFARYALSQIDEELAKNPNDARILLEKATALRSFGVYADALTTLAAASALSPNKESILIEYAVTQWQSGDFAGAEATFAKAYALGPQFDVLAQYAAGGHIVAGNVAEGDKLLLDRFGTTTIDNTILVAAYYKAQRFDRLVPIIEMRAKASPDDVQTQFGLAQIYKEAGRVAEARALVTAFIATHPAYASQGAQLLAEFASGK